MKKILFLAVAVMIAAAVYTSCKKDDGGTTYPASIDGAYGTVANSGTAVLYINSASSTGLFGIISVSSQSVSVEGSCYGQFSYNRSEGTGSIVDTAKGSLGTVTFQVEAGDKRGNITVTAGDKSYTLSVLSSVDFPVGTWSNSTLVQAANDTLGFMVKTSGTPAEGGYVCSKSLASVVSSSPLAYSLVSTEFYGIGDGAIGMLSFVQTEKVENTWLSAGYLESLSTKSPLAIILRPGDNANDLFAKFNSGDGQTDTYSREDASSWF